MTYASNTRRPNPAALLGAIGIPTAVGALLVVGLAVKAVITPAPEPLEGPMIDEFPLPPPPPAPVDPATPTSPKPPSGATTTTPSRPDAIPFDFGSSDPVGTLPGLDDLGPVTGPVDFGIPEPTPSASPFDPVGAAPRGNPGKWVTNADYRPRWIREEMSGRAAFTLSIDAGGKVTGCSITRSTGHAALDAATCDLVAKRARFDAARDGNGKAVAGTYSNSVTWNIPE